jgi:hypothetical protein
MLLKKNKLTCFPSILHLKILPFNNQYLLKNNILANLIHIKKSLNY